MKKIIELFDKGKKASVPADLDITIKDCDDFVGIAGPIANNGGSQAITIHNGDVHNHFHFDMNADDAVRMQRAAIRIKGELEAPKHEKRAHVAMTWKRLDTDPAKTAGKSSADKAIIPELHAKAKNVFFDEPLLWLKQKMIDDQANPYRKQYDVDVEVSRVGGKIVSYKVTYYHGALDLDEDAA